MGYSRQVLFLLIGFITFSSSISSLKKRQSITGEEFVVKSNTWIYGFSGFDVLRTPNYFCYTDSFLLERMHTFYSKSTMGKLDTSYFKISYFRFDNLRDKVAYFYKEFTPDAKPIGKLSLDVPLDSVSIVKNGSALITRKDPSFLNDYQFTIAPDTVVDNIIYKRYKAFNTRYKSYAVYWAVKDDVLLPFTLLPKLSSESGFCFVKVEYNADSTHSTSIGGTGIELLRRTFNDEERTVFNAWRQNCIKYKDRPFGIDKDADL
jgi:hypothetical protein